MARGILETRRNSAAFNYPVKSVFGGEDDAAGVFVFLLSLLSFLPPARKQDGTRCLKSLS